MLLLKSLLDSRKLSTHSHQLFRQPEMLRLGLCCLFHEYEDVKFRTTTVKHITSLSRGDALAKLDEIVLHNANALLKALRYCADHNIGCFRVNSQIWPIYTHQTAGYRFEDLPSHQKTADTLAECKAFAGKNNIRLSMHPDQFVVLNSQKEQVVVSSIAELEYQARVCTMIGADVMNIHGGGAFGDKTASLESLAKGLDRLSTAARSLVTLENDDRTYTPADLLPFCEKYGVPLVYDVHHHRCTDGVDKVTDGVILTTTVRAQKTWNGREPLMHISSPVDGWANKSTANKHHDMILIADFPKCWQDLAFDWTLEVEAKHKEGTSTTPVPYHPIQVAVSRLAGNLTRLGVRLWTNTGQLPALNSTTQKDGVDQSCKQTAKPIRVVVTQQSKTGKRSSQKSSNHESDKSANQKTTEDCSDNSGASTYYNLRKRTAHQKPN